ncbi:MAG: hypothetical protein HZA90_25695 [Verrucomicrobia bacterium]|nr:hypothetical protein [Verrucomicrobiota bacterium]
MKRLLSLAVLAALAALLHAQQYEIKWSTIDGGGGTSTGGVYSVSGTIGQPDAGAMIGGSYSVVGGFWSFAAAVQTPGSPVLRIVGATPNVVVCWPDPSSGFSLQQTHVLATPPATSAWTAVTNSAVVVEGEKTVTLPAVPGDTYFRLVK